MKIKKSELKTCDCAYLYNDGHFVMVHEKRDREAMNNILKTEHNIIISNVAIKEQIKKDRQHEKNIIERAFYGSSPIAIP